MPGRDPGLCPVHVFLENTSGVEPLPRPESFWAWGARPLRPCLGSEMQHLTGHALRERLKASRAVTTGYGGSNANGSMGQAPAGRLRVVFAVRIERIAPDR